MKYNSASAINTYNTCPRRYYYKYKLKLPEAKNIHQLAGSIVHKAIKIKSLNPQKPISEIFDKIWNEHNKDLKELGVSKDELLSYYNQFKQMALNWEKDFDPKAKLECEKELYSERYQLFGIIDEISEKNGKIRILDNKTSQFEKLLPEHKLQLGIYALLFQENFGRLPDYAGIRFLRSGKKEYVSVNESLLNKVRYYANLMRIRILPDDIESYPKKISFACKWNGGRCSYYEKCFSQSN